MAQKIIYGFVVQEFDDESEEFVSQEFVAGDQVEYEGDEDFDDDKLEAFHSAYLSMNMVQPREEIPLEAAK